MQTNSAVCDFHQSSLLPRAKATITYADGTTEEAIPCQDPSCHRCYSPCRGYFYANAGEYPNFGNPMRVPHCHHNSEPVYAFLMRKEDVLVWACPECAVTQLLTPIRSHDVG
jgi:hypothetical protein